MKEELDKLWNQLKDTASDEQKKLFIHYCLKLIQLKEENTLSEEEAACKMVEAIKFDNLTNSPECDAIFDVAGITEIPRTSSYTQPLGNWDENTANQIKQGEWKRLIAAIQNAKTSLKIR